MIPKLFQSALKVATGWAPGLGTFVEEALDHLNERGERQSKLAKLLDFDDLRWTEDASPAALLRADFGVVPFHGRVAERGDFAAWSRAEQRLRLRLYTAPGGFGKTRLLRFLVGFWREHGWDAGFLREGALDEAGTQVLFGDAKKPLLVVLDYAESRRAEVEAVVRAARASERKVRIVLLARSEGDWWKELRRAGGGVGDFFQGPAVDLPIRLGPLTDSPELRLESYEKAVQAFASELKKPVPESAPPALDDEDFQRVLLIHASALASVEGAQITAGGLLQWLVERECRGIERVREDLGAGEELQRGIEQAAALLTLAQGVDSRAEAVSIISRVPAIADQPRAMQESIAEALHVLYRGRRWCDGVEPDLVGEHLVGRCLDDAPELLEAAFGGDVPEEQLEAALTLLNRLAQRQRERQNLLQCGIARDPAQLALPVVRVAISAGDPIGRVLADVLAKTNNLTAARKLDGEIPYPTTSLRELAVEVDRILLADDKASGDMLSEEARSAAARRLNNLSNRLGDLGHREDALAAVQEAVDIYGDLAASLPGSFRPDLAASLNGLSNRLASLGRHDEALAVIQKAVVIRRQLASDRPDVFCPTLAQSLNNLSNRLFAVGRREEGLAAIEQAVEICRQLTAGQAHLFHPKLAGYLNNQSNRLSAVGKHEEALATIWEAVDILRDLAAVRPDAFRPDLAMGLVTLSIRLSYLGRHEEALAASQHAVDIYYELAAARPAAFRPDLATSLSNLSNRLAALRRPEDALAAIEEAVDIRLELAAALPNAFRPDLAGSLNNLSNRLADLGRRKDALAAIREAADIYRELADARPDAFRPGLALSLNNLSVQLADLGRREEALTAIQEAVDIYRDLAAARPDAFCAGLATSINNLSNRLADLARCEEALAAIQEAVDIRRDLATVRPDAFRPDLAQSLNNLSIRLAAIGRRDDALAAIQEAVYIRRDLGAVRADAFQPDLAGSVSVLHDQLRESGDLSSALEATNEALDILEPYFRQHPAAFARLMGVIVQNCERTAADVGVEPDHERLLAIREILATVQQTE